MKKKIVILGSTGSIGKSTLEIIKKDKKSFEIILLTANNNYKTLVNQAKFFKAKNVLINNKKYYEKTKLLLKRSICLNIPFSYNEEECLKLAKTIEKISESI